jgi:hypothetical protein
VIGKSGAQVFARIVIAREHVVWRRQSIQDWTQRRILGRFSSIDQIAAHHHRIGEWPQAIDRLDCPQQAGIGVDASVKADALGTDMRIAELRDQHSLFSPRSSHALVFVSPHSIIGPMTLARSFSR